MLKKRAMNEKIYQTLKSAETEDWLDYHVVRPICYYCAVVFAKLHVHPNAVTILSMFFGAGSCLFYAHGSWYYEGLAGFVLNLWAVFLLIVADILDCTDGQLARMTGQSSRLGRILDGAAGFVWFIPIYVSLVWRFYHHHSLEFGLLGLSDDPATVEMATVVVFVIGLISGIAGIAGQQRLADYYIQAHLYFLKGEKGSELDNSARQQQLYDQMAWKGNLLEKFFQLTYVNYTRKQEKATPEFQRLLTLMREKYGGIGDMPASLREELHARSLALMPWNGLLTFNFRSTWLCLFCLLDVPVAYFLFEIIAMGLLTKYINHRHETFCRQVAGRMK